MVAGANMQVAIVGTVQTSPAAGSPNQTVNQGTPAAIANRWPVQITDGTNTVPVIVSTRGNFLSVGEGSVTPGTSLTAATTGTGVVIDFGSASLAATFQVVVTGTVTAGAVQFMGSVDGVTFTPLGTPTTAGGGTAANPLTLTTNGTFLMSFNGIAVRYFRCDVSTTITGGATVTAKIAAF